MKALLTEKVAVQLVHIETETSREDHGFVKVKAPDGTVLAESNDLQHNRNYHKQPHLLGDLMLMAQKAGLKDIRDASTADTPDKFSSYYKAHLLPSYDFAALGKRIAADAGPQTPSKKQQFDPPSRSGEKVNPEVAAVETKDNGKANEEILSENSTDAPSEVVA